ncbi:hypothetical protein [uncultured Dokdonia sp.]|uniref:hypothetical protein n=1 Tax=uncultured Dokdonia sp. TaxID=575653 RepID=UPI0026356736|nr:hypothetical protein [uncultured Dokdonia sp.]
MRDYSEEQQNVHNALIDLLNKQSLYRDEKGKGRCKKRSKSINSSDLSKLSINEINLTVKVIVDFLNLTGGSIGDYNLYELLQSYLLDTDKRKAINEIIKI